MIIVRLTSLFFDLMINFYTLDLRKKGLSALCRMVLNPTQYKKEFLDDNLLILNSSRPKNNKLEYSFDVTNAQELGEQLSSSIPLNLEVCHSLGECEENKDFIFDGGGGWLDPGPVINWQSDLEEPLQVLM